MLNKIKKKLKYLKNHNPWLKLLWFMTLAVREKRARKIGDQEYITMLYKHHTGTEPDWEHPKTFNEKLSWMKINFRHPLMPICADKYEVRKYLEDMGKGYLLNDMLAIYDSVDKIDISELPERFVLKATHGSGTGWILIVKDKDEVNWKAYRHIFDFWLNHKIDWLGREWHYGEMTPRIICEKYLEDKSTGLMDYKFYCFSGVPKFVQVNIGRYSNKPVMNYYDLDWNQLSFGKELLECQKMPVAKPEHFNEMVQEAKELSKPFPFVRVDFYEANGRLYFGELTFYSAGGFDFESEEYDDTLGQWLNLPSPISTN